MLPNCLVQTKTLVEYYAMNRFRFSLRSLVLAVALVASGFSIPFRWKPWIMVAAVHNIKNRSGRSGPKEFHDGQRIAVQTTDRAVLIREFEEQKKEGKVLDRLRSKTVDDRRHRETWWEPSIYFSNDEETMLLEFSTRTEVWNRRHPEWWWGLGWLPSFWLTALVGFGLLWSLRRDRKWTKLAA